MEEIEKAEAAVREAEAKRDAAVAAYFSPKSTVSVSIAGNVQEAIVTDSANAIVYVVTKKGGRIGRHYTKCQLIKKGE